MACLLAGGTLQQIEAIARHYEEQLMTEPAERITKTTTFNPSVQAGSTFAAAQAAISRGVPVEPRSSISWARTLNGEYHTLLDGTRVEDIDREWVKSQVEVELDRIKFVASLNQM